MLESGQDVYDSIYWDFMRSRDNEGAYHQSYWDHTRQTEGEISASFLAVVLLPCEITPMRHRRQQLFPDIIINDFIFVLLLSCASFQ